MGSNALFLDPTGMGGGSVPDISLASQPAAPPLQTVNQPDPNAVLATSWINSAGAFGVSIASLLSGTPATVTSGANSIRTAGAVTAQPATANVGAILLLGLGVLLLVMVLGK